MTSPEDEVVKRRKRSIAIVSLDARIREIVAHFQTFPDHRYNCACMDVVNRKMRADIKWALKEAGAEPGSNLREKSYRALRNALRKAIDGVGI